jgi:hypothetical protein
MRCSTATSWSRGVGIAWIAKAASGCPTDRTALGRELPIEEPFGPKLLPTSPE